MRKILERKILERKIGEIMLEDIFLSPKNSNISFDYFDLRNVRSQNTLKAVYCLNIDLSDATECNSFTVQELNLNGISYGIIELVFAENLKLENITHILDKFSEFRTDVKCSIFNHSAVDLEENKAKINLFLFSAKTDEYNSEDRRIDGVLEAYRNIHLQIQASECCVANYDTDPMNQLQPIVKFSANERLRAYYELLSYFTINNDTATFVKECIDNAIAYLKKDIKNGYEIEISTLQYFMFYSGNLLWHLMPYYSNKELKSVNLKLNYIWRKLRENSPGYIKEISEYACKISKLNLKKCTDVQFNELICCCKDLAAKGNNSNRSDIFYALESISKKAYFLFQGKRSITAALLAIEIGSLNNPEIRQCEVRLQTLKELCEDASSL